MPEVDEGKRGISSHVDIKKESLVPEERKFKYFPPKV